MPQTDHSLPAVPASTAPRVLVAPDKFKGTLSGREAADAIEEGVKCWAPQAHVRKVVVADGGEGTVAAAIEAGATAVSSSVRGPLDDDVSATWAVWGDVAIIELASASGLQMLDPTDETARRAHTYGVGQLVTAALDRGVSRIAIGLGGSAGTDGGSGALRALGARFVETHGGDVELGGAGLLHLAEIDLTGLDDRLAAVELVVVCDVAAPLLGPDGATAVFSPQKGASLETQTLLEKGLATLADVIGHATGRQITSVPWAGAAGGTAGGLHGVLGAQFVSGIDFIADMVGLDEHLAWADLVITGEGSFDQQTLQGKAPFGVIERARAARVPAVVVAGRIDIDSTAPPIPGIHAWAAARDVAPAPEAAIGPEAARWIQEAAHRALTLASTGFQPRPTHH